MKRNLGERDQLFKIGFFAIVFAICLAGAIIIGILGASLYDNIFCIVVALVSLMPLISMAIAILDLRSIRESLKMFRYQVGEITGVRKYRDYFVYVRLPDGKIYVCPNFFFGKYAKSYKGYSAMVCFRNKLPLLIDVIKKPFDDERPFR